MTDKDDEDKDKEEKEEAEAKSDAENEESSSSSESEDEPEKKMERKTLFSIDLCSPLGQRVLKHMTAEAGKHENNDSEEFCRTPIKV